MRTPPLLADFTQLRDLHTNLRINLDGTALLAWRSVCAALRCGNRWLRNGQRKQIIRTHLLSETSSDYIGLVREAGLEPARPE